MRNVDCGFLSAVALAKAGRIGLLAAAVGVAAAAPKVVKEGPDEVVYLDGLADPNRWGPAECTLAPSRQLKASGRPTLHMHIPVDHKGGEKNYPIGWPRAYLKLRPAERSWGQFERFEFIIHAAMTRPKPPRQALSLQIQCPDRQRNNIRNLSEIRLGRWVRVSIPIREIKHIADVARLGLNISESNYRHGEKLDFRVGAFRLARAAEFALASLAVRSRVMYADRPTLKLELDVVGPPGKIGKGVGLSIQRGVDVVHRLTVPVRRGVQMVRIDLAAAKLPPGAYTAVAFAGDKRRERSAAFRLVESPWQEGRR